MELPEIQYETGDFDDILRQDSRYDSRAYDFVMRVVAEASLAEKGHVSGQDLLGFFRDLALDAYGPLAYTVLTDWGLETCEDVGAVVMNLCKGNRISRSERDSADDFVGGFDFRTEFLGPFERS